MPSTPDPAVLAGSPARPGTVAPDGTAGLTTGRTQSDRRPALDGIRAIAVVAVVVYHFGGGAGSWLRGGFLGVDVFFVLSGYLITGLLLREQFRTGRISLLKFWVRRVKRLAPALFLMLIAVSAWVWWATPPADYPLRREDVFWTLGYLANWHLSGTETYFAAFGSVSPFRHAWSLAVEEQFYLLWPTVVLATLWVGGRLARPTRDWPVMITGRRLLVGVGLAGGALSVLAFAQLYDPVLPSVAYYSTRGRVQELFAGALLAVLFSARPGVTRSRWLPLVALLGLGGVLAGFMLMPDTASFYYYGGALLVSLAAVLLIGGVERNPGSGLARALSWRPAVWLGRISYGVYLWHWPVTVALPLSGGTGEKVGQQALRVALTLGLSVGSFYLLELPVQRSRRVLRSAPRVLFALTASAVLVIVTGVQATSLPGTIYTQAKYTADRGCTGERTDRLVYCVWPRTGSEGTASSANPPELAILGDSTIRGLSRGLDTWAEANDTSWIEAAWKQCSATGVMMAPTVDPDVVDVRAETCHRQSGPLITSMLATYRPKVVLIGEFWLHDHLIHLDDGTVLMPGTPEHEAEMTKLYTQVVDEIASYGGRAVFLELPMPGEQMGTQFAQGRPAAHSRGPAAGNGMYNAAFNQALRAAAAARPDDATTVSVSDVVCPGGTCPAAIGDTLIRMDGVHYTQKFAAKLAPIILLRAGVTS